MYFPLFLTIAFILFCYNLNSFSILYVLLFIILQQCSFASHLHRVIAVYFHKLLLRAHPNNFLLYLGRLNFLPIIKLPSFSQKSTSSPVYCVYLYLSVDKVNLFHTIHLPLINTIFVSCVTSTNSSRISFPSVNHDNNTSTCLDHLN